MNWSDLSMSQRSELMSIYLKNGITSLDEMKKHYNSLAKGGSIDDPPEGTIYKASYELPEVNVVSKRPFTVDDAIQKSINDVNSFYYNDVVPRLIREHKGLKTIPDTMFPYINKEDIVEEQSFRNAAGFATPDLKIHTIIRPSLTVNANNEATLNENNYLYRELLAHENTHRWQYDLPKRDRSYTKKSKKLLNAAYIPGEGLNHMYGPLWPLFKHSEQEAENRKARYVIWQKLKNELGRTPTIEETDNYIKNILLDSDIETTSNSSYFKNPKVGKSKDEYQKQIDAIREALIHVASNKSTNDSIKNRINYAAKGGKLDTPPERFFGIATPEVIDNTVYQPTYGTLLPEVKVAAFPGAIDYDIARYKSGQLSSATLDSIAKKRRTGESQFMQDVNKLAWIPNGAMGLAGGFSGALANPYLWGAIGLSSAAQNIEDKNYGEAALDVGLTFLGPELQLINKTAEATRFGKSARIASELNKAVKSTRLQPKSVENPVHNLFYRKSDKPYLQEYIPTIEPSISDLFQIKGGLQRTADRLGTNINHYYNNVISPEEFMKLQHSVLPISEDFIQPRYIPSGFPYGLKESKILMPYDKMRQNPLFAKYKDLPDNEFKEVMDDLVGSHEFIHYHNNRIRKNILNNKYNPNMSEFQKHKLSYDGDKYFQGMSYPEGDYSNSYLLAGNGTEVNARLAQLYNIFNTNYLTPNEFHIAKRFYPSSILDNDMTTFFNRINDEEAFLRTANDNVGLLYNDGGPIHIKPENRGKFTALKKRTGHSASWFKENGTPAQKKMAVFELNSKKWRK